MKYFIFCFSFSYKDTNIYPHVYILNYVTSYNCCLVSDRSKFLSGYRVSYGHIAFITGHQEDLDGQIYLMKHTVPHASYVFLV